MNPGFLVRWIAQRRIARTSPLFFVTALSTLTAAPTAGIPAPVIETSPLQMAPMTVIGSSAGSLEDETPLPQITYDPDFMRAVGALSVDDFLTTLPQNLTGSNAPLVLINGRRASVGGQSFVDLKSIPPGMVERIDVSPIGSAAYGAEATSGVINIVLKKNYVGSQLTVTEKSAFLGGGLERRLNLLCGFAKGKLTGTAFLTVSKQAPLLASARPFSANEDHTARGGHDFRLPWGYPAVVQAVSGNLNGVFDSNGNPVSVALVPPGQNGENLTPGQFIPGAPIVSGGPTIAAGQRRFNAAGDLSLIPESIRFGGGLNLNYALNSQLDFSANCLFSDSKVKSLAPPPVSPALTSSVSGNPAAIVPAADNPFGQDVAIGMIHQEFGPTRHTTEASSDRILLGLRDTLSETWELDGALGFSEQRSNQAFTDLDPAAFAAALAASDPSNRFNPFGDAATGPIDASLYPGLSVERTTEAVSQLETLDFSARGQVADIWGGPTKLTLGGDGYHQDVAMTSVNSGTGQPPETTIRRTTGAVYTTLSVPLFGEANARPLLKRLDLDLTGRYEEEGRAGTQRSTQAGFTWQPIPSLLLRMAMIESLKAPPLPNLQNQVSNLTLIDPRRSPPTATGVQSFNEGGAILGKETSRSLSCGVVLQPSFLRGFQFQVNYTDRKQTDLAIEPNAQSVVFNEAFFSNRVIRAAPSAQDLDLGQPGPITAVDTTPGNFGNFASRNVAFVVDYRIPPTRFGRFRLSINAVRTLESRYELKPGVPFISDTVGTFSPPDWNVTSLAAWLDGPWSVSANYSYSGHFFAANEEIGDYKTLDLFAGYSFLRPLWGKFGRGTSLNVGIKNLFAEDPPQADTITGFSSGSPLGRIYQVSVTVPL